MNELLSPEIFIHIFSFLEYEDLYQLPKICILWRNLSCDSSLWMPVCISNGFFHVDKYNGSWYDLWVNIQKYRSRKMLLVATSEINWSLCLLHNETIQIISTSSTPTCPEVEPRRTKKKVLVITFMFFQELQNKSTN